MKSVLTRWILLVLLAFFAFGQLSFAAEQVKQPPATPATKEQQAKPSDKSEPAKQSIGQVVWVKGDVKAAAPNQSPRALQRRSPIYEHDAVMTDKTGTGEIVFTDGGIISLRADTTIKIDEYKFGKNVPASQVKSVTNLVKGGFRTITGIVAKVNPDSYQVKTPVATIGVRGTIYYVYRNCNESNNCDLYLKIERGTLVVKNDQGSVVLTEGSKQVYAKISRGKAPQVSEQPPEGFDAKGAPEIVEAPAPDSTSEGGASEMGDSSTNSSSSSESQTGNPGGTKSGVIDSSMKSGADQVVKGFCIGG